MQTGVGLLDTGVVPICIIIALDIVITLRFSINCSIVICSHTVLFALMREASSETYGPQVYLLSYLFPFYYFVSLLCIFNFPIYIIKYQKYIYLIILSLSDLTFAIGRKGIDNPFTALGASVWLFVQVHRLETCVYLLLDWYLCSQTFSTFMQYMSVSHGYSTFGESIPLWSRTRVRSKRDSYKR